MTARTYWCELAWLGGPTADWGVVVEVDAGRFTSVRAGVAEPPSGAERLGGVVLPGFANGHSHAFHRALRGRTHGGKGTFWTWRERMYTVAERLTPDTYFHLARATYAEMALAGVTSVGEFHYLHHGPGGVPYADPNAMGEALLLAAAEAGIRITMLDTCYLHGGFGEPPNEVQRRFSDRTADRWAERVEALAGGGNVRIGAAIHSVRAVDPDAARVVAAWAHGRSAPLHAHVAEQPAEVTQCLLTYNRTPVELLASNGVLSDRFTAVHATHLSANDLTLLGGVRSWVCCCPTTERDLADGITPARAIVDAGGRLSLGSDSHAVIDLLEEARAVELDERLSTLERGNHAVEELLGALTDHACLGWDDVGRLAEGAAADLVVIGLDGVRTAGTTADHALGSVVFAATASDVRDVMVAGRWVVRDGRHATIDVPAELGAAVRATWAAGG